MDFKKVAESNKILEYKSGSHMYGLNLPASDEDYMGVFMPNKELVLGFRECDEVDLSFKDKLENGKNSKDAIDRKLYNYKKFIKLAKQNNPNILESLFVNQKDIVFINEFGKRLLENRHLFPHKGLKNRFIGYAISQKKKMYIKRDNFIVLEKAEDILLKFFNDGNEKMLLPLCEKYQEFTDVFKSKYDTDEHYKIGERKLVKNQTVKKALQEIRKLIGEASNRKELIKDKGFDYKFGSHLIRLLHEGIELMNSGTLEFPLKNKKEILEIKTGLWSFEDVISYADELEDKFNIVCGRSTLPNKPQDDKIEKFIIEELEKWLFN